jgi:pimeloyl-ACP methyl ester carboxylesterase
VALSVHQQGDPDRPTVVLVHGYPDDHAVWDLVAERLVNRHHVVTYDVRGAGCSDAPAEQAGYALDALVADLQAVIAAASPHRRVHLVGHDWGSIQGWAAVTDPVVGARIASFTSISGPALEHVAAWARSHRHPGGGRWRAAAVQARRSWYIVALRSPFAPRVWRGRLAERWPETMARSEGAAVDDRWPGPHVARNGANGVGLYRANLGRRSGHSGHSGGGHPVTEIPVQLLVPLDDRYVTPALLEGIEALAPDLVRRDVDGGHWLPRVAPDLVAESVAAHVAAVEAAAGAGGSGSPGSAG